MIVKIYDPMCTYSFNSCGTVVVIDSKRKPGWIDDLSFLFEIEFLFAVDDQSCCNLHAG